jgi:hypothetical protein
MPGDTPVTQECLKIVNAGFAGGTALQEGPPPANRPGPKGATQEWFRRRYVLLPVKFFARRDGLMWGRLAACGRLLIGPASGARLRARRPGPRQPGISRAVALWLCCSAGQVLNLRWICAPPVGVCTKPALGRLKIGRRLKTCPTRALRGESSHRRANPVPRRGS